MKRIVFPFFLTRLLLSLGVFLVRLTWHLHSTFLMAAIALTFALLNTKTYLEIIQLAAPTPSIIFQQDKKNLELELEKQLSVLEKQPTHRDALYNLSVIYEKLGDTSESQKYLEKARYQDPNHPIFQE